MPEFNLATALRFLQAVTPAAAALPAVKAVFDVAVSTLSKPDEKEAKESYRDLIADNADGHRRLQEKLAEAARR